MQTGMSVSDLKADQDAFFERKRLCETIGRTFESVPLFWSKVYNFTGGLLSAKIKRFILFFS